MRRKMFGMTEGEPRIYPVGKTVLPRDCDYICVEGDAEWTRMPRAS